MKNDAGENGIKRIALIFEFAALNGGERSMLAVLDWLVRHRTGDGVPHFEFVAIAPTSGPLFAALTGRGIAVHSLPLRDETGRRLPIETVLSELNALIRGLRVDLVHANSLSMGRLTGGLADVLPIPTIAHIRDILKLSRAAVGNLNRNRRIVAVSDATRS
ncbi:MAG: hypothetical protein IID45_14545, partial [Planctomycetes bacterium]|nr:hypothetical protein [Planctomycetota bacterium]